jgi:hypothetical protein
VNALKENSLNLTGQTVKGMYARLGLVLLLLAVFLAGAGCTGGPKEADLTKNKKPAEVLVEAVKVASQWESNQVDELLSAKQGPLLESQGAYFRDPFQAHYEMKFTNPESQDQVNLTLYIANDSVYFKDNISGTWAKASQSDPLFSEMIQTLKSPTASWERLVAGATEISRADDVKDDEGRPLAVYKIAPDWKTLGMVGNLQASEVMEGTVLVKVQKDNLYIRGIVMEFKILNPTEGPTELRYEITPKKINEAAPIVIPEEALNAPEE